MLDTPAVAAVSKGQTGLCPPQLCYLGCEQQEGAQPLTELHPQEDRPRAEGPHLLETKMKAVQSCLYFSPEHEHF